LSIKKTIDENEIEKGYGTKWVWTALDPDSRLIICALVGDRTLKSCREYFKKLLARIDNKPLFVSDELVHYETVLKENFSTSTIPERKGNRGRKPTKPKLTVDEDLN
jgi:transposase-like protein